MCLRCHITNFRSVCQSVQSYVFFSKLTGAEAYSGWDAKGHMPRLWKAEGGGAQKYERKDV